MDINQFFELPEDEREALIDAHLHRQYVISVRDGIANERRKLDTRELNNQMNCNHLSATSRYVANENEFGNLTGGGTHHHFCPDCLNRWTTDK